MSDDAAVPAARVGTTLAAASRRATLAGVGALALWAVLAALSRAAVRVPPLQLTAITFAVGGLAALAWAAARGRGAVALGRGVPPLAWAHGVGGLFGFHALYFAALALAPPVEANLVNYAWPLLIVLLSGPVLGMPLGPRRLAGVAMGAVGCALLVGANAAFPPGAWLGLSFAALSALTWALYSVLARRLASGVPGEALAAFSLATAALAALAHAAFEGGTVVPTAREGFALALMGLGPLGAAFLLWDAGMKRGDPRLLGTLAYAVPVASTLLLVASGEGALTWRVALAAALVAGGGLLAARASS